MGTRIIKIDGLPDGVRMGQVADLPGLRKVVEDGIGDPKQLAEIKEYVESWERRMEMREKLDKKCQAHNIAMKKKVSAGEFC